MKICLVNNLYYPHQRGGAEVVVEKIINGFLRLNHQVVLITLGRQTKIFREGNLTIYRIKPLNIFSFLDINKRAFWLRIFWHPLDVFNFFAASKIKRILLAEKPEIVITHNLKGISYLIPKVIRQLRLKHIHTLHDVQLSRPSGLLLYGQEKPFLVIDKIYEKICRWLFDSPDAVVSPSQWLMEYYKVRGFFYESKKVVLPNPVVFQKVDKIEKHRRDDQAINFLYVGQLERSKGIILLIDVFKKLSFANWHLTIVGSGGLSEFLKNSIDSDSRFKMVGRVQAHGLTSYYRQADLTIVPSLCYENSPTVIYESLAANVPVIASDIGGIGELVKDNYNGFTFTPGNEKNLQEVLEHFLAHPENIEVLKKNCFISVRNFSINNYLNKLLTIV